MDLAFIVAMMICIPLAILFWYKFATNKKFRSLVWTVMLFILIAVKISKY